MNCITSLSQIIFVTLLIYHMPLTDSLRCYFCPYLKCFGDLGPRVHECNVETVEAFHQYFKIMHDEFQPKPNEPPFSCLYNGFYKDAKYVGRISGCVYEDEDYCALSKADDPNDNCFKCSSDECNSGAAGPNRLKLCLELPIAFVLAKLILNC